MNNGQINIKIKINSDDDFPTIKSSKKKLKLYDDVIFIRSVLEGNDTFFTLKYI